MIWRNSPAIRAISTICRKPCRFYIDNIFQNGTAGNLVGAKKTMSNPIEPMAPPLIIILRRMVKMYFTKNAVQIYRVCSANKSVSELITKMLNSLRPDLSQMCSKPRPKRCHPLKMCTARSSLLMLKLTRMQHKFPTSK